MTETYRYKAFISYSHRDKAAGDRLLKDLENYRVPERLVGKAATNGTAIPSQVGHIFRDRDELPAAEDLTAEVKKALTRSEFMIVLCSPAAAASRWVNREIIEFKKLTGERRILSVILSGEPFASNNGAPEDECLPPALRFKLGKNGTLTNKPAEPLAADFRPEGDGPRRGRLKLVAGMLDIGLDALIERDLQRKMRRVMAVTAVSIAAMIGMASLTYEAVTARQDAERHRSEAEGLIEFMLTDHRDKLIGVGRLDVMTEVNEQAMEYYRKQGNLSDFPTESLDRRARVLLAMGENDEDRGNYRKARNKFEEFHRTARALWQQDSDNPARILAYARSVNRLALTDHTTQNLNTALDQFTDAKNILDTIHGPATEKDDFLQLSALVNGNICATYLGINQQPEKALPFCERSVAESELLIAHYPANKQLRYEYIFHLGWLGEGMAARDDIRGATKNLKEAIRLSDELVAKSPNNTRWQEQQIEVYSHFAKFLTRQGQSELSMNYVAKAYAISRSLVNIDPANSVWVEYENELLTLLEKENSYARPN